MRTTLAGILAAIVLTPSMIGYAPTMRTPAARAGSSDTSDVACGSVPAGWNAPNGAFVTNRGSGPVRAVIDAVGEYRTHSMISHGAGGWVTHETMHSPGTNGWPTYCSTPLRENELRYGYPGASQTRQGGIYTFLGYTTGHAPEFIAYQMTKTNGAPTSHGADIANDLWNVFPYWWAASQQDGGQGLYRIGSPYNPGGGALSYNLYEYRWFQNTNIGWIGYNNGMVCSTLIAHAHYHAGKGEIVEKTYSHSQLQSAGSALYSAVESDCSNNTGFWTDIGAAFSCAIYLDFGICDDAARQVRNCMAANQCGSDDEDHWNDVNNDPNATATSVSPDRIGGWSGHPWQGYPTSGVSAWAYDGNNTLQWNAGGSGYACWF